MICLVIWMKDMDRKLLEYFLFKKVLDNYISNNIYSLYIKKELR
jgi:hypothetical protein